MNRESDDQQDMRPEYDIRGGTRGKYFGRYNQAMDIEVSLTFEETAFIATCTGASVSVGTITRAVSYPPLYSSPGIQIGDPTATVHAG